MSAWLVGLLAFYTVFITEIIHAIHVALDGEEPAFELSETPHPD